MSIVPRVRFDAFVQRRYHKTRAKIWGEIENFLLENPDTTRIVDGFVNKFLNHSATAATDVAVKRGKRLVEISVGLTKAAAHLHGQFPPETRRKLNAELTMLILEFSLTESGYEVDEGTLHYQFEIPPDPPEQAEQAEVVEPLQIGSEPAPQEEAGEQQAPPPADGPRRTRGEGWKKKEEQEEVPGSPSPRPEARTARQEPEPEVVVGQIYKNSRGLARRVDAVTDEGKVQYMVIVGSPRIPEGTPGESTVWSFVKWTKG